MCNCMGRNFVVPSAKLQKKLPSAVLWYGRCNVCYSTFWLFNIPIMNILQAIIFVVPRLFITFVLLL